MGNPAIIVKARRQRRRAPLADLQGQPFNFANAAAIALLAGAAALGSPAQESAAAPGVAAAATAEPAPPAGPMETALAQGPAPLAPDIEIGAAIEITNTDPETGEVISVPATFVSEDPLGVRIRDAEGTEHIVPREEIEAGVSVLAPRGAGRSESAELYAPPTGRRHSRGSAR